MPIYTLSFPMHYPTRPLFEILDMHLSYFWDATSIVPIQATVQPKAKDEEINSLIRS
jgi:hypothetical protein